MKLQQLIDKIYSSCQGGFPNIRTLIGQASMATRDDDHLLVGNVGEAPLQDSIPACEIAEKTSTPTQCSGIVF